LPDDLKPQNPPKDPAAIQPVNQEKIETIVRQIVSTEIFSGPLPAPKTLKEYDQIMPGLANRIVTMAENQSAHRQQLENIVIRSDRRNSLLGLVIGGIVALSVLVVGAYLITIGEHYAGTFLCTTDLISLAGIFVYGNKKRAQEREKRRNRNKIA